MGPYRNNQKQSDSKIVKTPLSKSVQLDANHRVEILLADNGQIYFTMKSVGLITDNGNWSTADWFLSQLSFPPAVMTELSRVLKPWLLCYVENHIAHNQLPEIQSAVQSLVKSSSGNTGN